MRRTYTLLLTTSADDRGTGGIYRISRNGRHEVDDVVRQFEEAVPGVVPGRLIATRDTTAQSTREEFSKLFDRKARKNIDTARVDEHMTVHPLMATLMAIRTIPDETETAVAVVHRADFAAVIKELTGQEFTEEKGMSAVVVQGAGASWSRAKMRLLRNVQPRQNYLAY